MTRSLTLPVALLSAGLMSCGGAVERPTRRGPDPCEIGRRKLSRMLGPELAGIRQVLKIEGAGPIPACALIYTQVSEELPGEVADADGGQAEEQQLALAIPDAVGRLSVTLWPASTSAPSAVMLTPTTQDLTGDGTPELVIREDSQVAGTDYQGLRVLTLGNGQARDVLSIPLKVKTPEGLEMLASWRAGTIGTTPAILLEAAGTYQIFSWDPTGGGFALDVAATAARNPKPIAPAPPAGTTPTPDAEPKADAAKTPESPKAKAPTAPAAPIIDMP